jgi:hypothetical protein
MTIALLRALVEVPLPMTNRASWGTKFVALEVPKAVVSTYIPNWTSWKEREGDSSAPAIAPLPTAREKDPNAALLYPLAVERSPNASACAPEALELCPSAMLDQPDAVEPEPIA